MDPVGHLANPRQKYQFVLNSILPEISVHLPPPFPFDAKVQERLLGPFNKPGVELPMVTGKLDLRLLGFVREPLPSSQRILRDLAAAKTGCYYAASVSVSGGGKTTTLFDVAMQHFLLLLDCFKPGGSTKMNPTMDNNFQIFVTDLEELKAEAKGDLVQFRLQTQRRIRVELFARFLYLRALFQLDKDLTPQQYLLGQLNGGQKSIANLVDELENLSSKSAQVLLNQVIQDLDMNYLKKDNGLVVGIDEANTAMDFLFPGDFLSPNGNHRGLFTPINIVLVSMLIGVRRPQ